MIYLDGRLQDVHTGSDASVGFGLTNAVVAAQIVAVADDEVHQVRSIWSSRAPSGPRSSMTIGSWP